MRKYQDKNLWSVDYTAHGCAIPRLLVCGASASVAETKARRVFKRDGARATAISGIHRIGVIDAF